MEYVNDLLSISFSFFSISFYSFTLIRSGRLTTMENGDPSSGFIRLEVNNVSTLTANGKQSEDVDVEGMPWSLQVTKNVLGQTPYLVAFLNYIKNESNLWSFTVHCNFELISNTNEKNLEIKKEKMFNHQTAFMGAYIVEWKDLMDVTKGFVHDDKVMIEAKFSVKNIIGIRKVHRVDFTDKDNPRHDIALQIGGENIYVNKTYLSLHSPFFDRLFFGNFAEEKQKVVELKDIDRKFTDLLNVLYPSQAKVTESNYRYLLSLGDRFEIKVVLEKVEDYIFSSTKLTTADKLKLADEFRLVKLHDNCLGSFKSVQQITEITKTVGYKSLSNDAKAALMDKIARLSL